MNNIQLKNAIIEILKKRCDTLCSQCGINKDDVYIEDMADYLIANNLTIKPYLRDAKSDPPAEGVYVLAMCKNAYQAKYETPQIARLSCGIWYNYTSTTNLSSIGIDVTHWMPLPTESEIVTPPEPITSDEAKLIDILSELDVMYEERLNETGSLIKMHGNEDVAKHLIANGVTIKKHAHWILINTDTKDGNISDDQFKCSRCGSVLPKGLIYPPDFCCFCHSVMDETIK